MTYEDAHKSPIPTAYVTFQFGGNNFDKYQEFTVGDRTRSNDDVRLGCRNVSHCHRQQSFSGLPSPGRSHFTIENLSCLSI